MQETWPQIARFLADAHDRGSERPLQQALGGVCRLADHIARGRLARILYGWRSMLELCIQQTDHQPYSGPFLRVSAMDSGLVEFRLIDTMIRNRQWHRSVRPDLTVDQFERFLDQLRWTASHPDR